MRLLSALLLAERRNLFKRFNLSLVTTPVISGNMATETLASGQQLFVQTLLPGNASNSSADAAGVSRLTS
jgi:hypothetical protein